MRGLAVQLAVPCRARDPSASLGPAGAGFYFDWQKTYLPVFYLFALIMLVGAVIAFFMKPAPRRMDGVESTD